MAGFFAHIIRGCMGYIDKIFKNDQSITISTVNRVVKVPQSIDLGTYKTRLGTFESKYESVVYKGSIPIAHEPLAIFLFDGSEIYTNTSLKDFHALVKDVIERNDTDFNNPDSIKESFNSEDYLVNSSYIRQLMLFFRKVLIFRIMRRMPEDMITKKDWSKVLNDL